MAKNRKRRLERKVERTLLRLGERAWRRQIWRQIRHIEGRLGEIEEALIVAKYRKRAVDIGLREAEGEMLLKAHRGDPDGLAFLERKIKTLKDTI
jgi:hypothetical protein